MAVRSDLHRGGPFYNLYQIISFAAHLVILGLWIWLAVILFRRRSPASWMVLSGALLGLACLVFSYFGWPLLAAKGNFELENFIWISGFSDIVSKLLIAAGLTLHVLKGKSESERIVELEAIIRDRDGDGSEAAMKSQ